MLVCSKLGATIQRVEGLIEAKELLVQEVEMCRIIHTPGILPQGVNISVNNNILNKKGTPVLCVCVCDGGNLTSGLKN